MEWPTFLRSPLRRVLRRVSDDAPIDSTIDLASSSPTGDEALQLLTDARGERTRLRAVLTALDHLLVDAERKGFRPPVARWLGRVRDAVWDGEDVLDEFATDAALLHRQQQQGSSEVWDAFSDKLKSYQLAGVRRRLEDLVEEGELELGLEEEEEVADEPEEHHRPGDQIRASYEQLAPNQKECFAYCSLLPTDSLPPGIAGFSKNDLVQLWISQGFLDCDEAEALSMVRCGERHLQKLVSVSLLDDKNSLVDDETVYSQGASFASQGEGSEPFSYYAVGDPARDLAASVCRDYCIMPDDELGEEEELGGIPAPDRVRHLFVMTDGPRNDVRTYEHAHTHKEDKRYTWFGQATHAFLRPRGQKWRDGYGRTGTKPGDAGGVSPSHQTLSLATSLLAPLAPLGTPLPR